MKLATLVFFSCAGIAYAQPSDRAAGADQLFSDARDLVAKRDFAAACPKFEASLRLDPAVGTRLNLADCYEQLGRVASAWVTFRAAADAARGTKDDRVQIAQQRAASLEPRLPKLVVHVAPAMPADLVVERSGQVIDPALIGTPIFIDPGAYQVVARATGFRPRTVEVTAVEGKLVEIQIDPLEREIVTPRPQPDAPKPITTRDPGRTRRMLGLGIGIGGLALTGTGLAFGIAARSAWSSAFDDGLCTKDPLACSPKGQERTDLARSRATIATVATGLGLGLAITGAVIYLTAPKRTHSTSAVVPIVGGNEVGVAITGGF